MPPYPRELTFQESPSLLTSKGKQYLIYFGPRGELLLQVGTAAAWEEPRPLSQRAERYCAALDSDHLPHLVAMDGGGFYHQILSPEGEGEAAALFYREENKECSHFLFTGAGEGMLHLICLALAPSTERWWLLHHIYTGESWKKPRVIDFGGGASENYGDLAVDARGCLHLVYRIAGAAQAGLYYRSFDPAGSNWSKALPLSHSAAVDCPSIAVDERQNLHVLWRTILEGKYYICYRFMGGPEWDTAGWKPETVISPGMATPPLPFISYHFGELLIAWLEGGKLWRYRFSGDQWERIEPQLLEKPLPLRTCSFTPRGGPLSYRSLVESGGAPAGAPLSALLPAGEDDLGGDFSKLHRYSGKLVGRISDLSTEKMHLQEEVKKRSREMFLFSQQSEKNMRRMRQDLEDKDAELKKLQESFDRIVRTMKQKIEQSGQNRDRERRRYLGELQELKKERSQMEKIMLEKEKTIARLEKEIGEQRYRVERLAEENERLETRAAEGWSLKGLWERMGLHKKP